MPRRTRDPHVPFSLSVPKSLEARLERLIEVGLRQDPRAETSVRALARTLLLAIVDAHERDLGLPAYVPPPVHAAEPVFVPGSAAHLRHLARPHTAHAAPPAFPQPVQQGPAFPQTADEAVKAGLVVVRGGLDDHGDDFREVMAEVQNRPASAVPGFGGSVFAASPFATPKTTP